MRRRSLEHSPGCADSAADKRNGPRGCGPQWEWTLRCSAEKSLPRHVHCTTTLHACRTPHFFSRKDERGRPASGNHLAKIARIRFQKEKSHRLVATGFGSGRGGGAVSTGGQKRGQHRNSTGIEWCERQRTSRVARVGGGQFPGCR